jgi:hypothetical protein
LPGKGIDNGGQRFGSALKSPGKIVNLGYYAASFDGQLTRPGSRLSTSEDLRMNVGPIRSNPNYSICVLHVNVVPGLQLRAEGPACRMARVRKKVCRFLGR